MIRFEITIGKGEAARTRVVEFDPEDITLGFLEDMDLIQQDGTANKNALLRGAVADLLGLTRDESRALTLRQFNELGAALKDAAAAQQTIPNP